MNRADPTDNEPVEIPIDGVLDLHAFRRQDVVSVVEEYLRVCLEKRIYEVKIIHGKGRGVLRRTIQSFLATHPDVSDFGLDPGPSGWGATLVHLRTK